jgi:hypothetical protein
MQWKYQGANVQVPRTADIPPQFWSNKERSRAVQRVLDAVEPWRPGERPIETMRLQGERFMPIVVPVQGRKVLWGIHAGHHARKPQASPFVTVDFNTIERTDLFTIELEQTPERPKLVRAYPGDYIPPLPWQVSAKDADGGTQACLEFWRRHAYVFRRSAMLKRFSHAPNWYSR